MEQYVKACFLSGTKLDKEAVLLGTIRNYQSLVTQEETKSNTIKSYKLTCSVRVVSIQRPEVVICEKENRTTSVISIYHTA